MSNSRLLLAIVTLCSACGGSSFEAGGSGGAGGDASQAGATGSNGGGSSSAGAASGGSAGDSSAGSGATAGGHPAGGAATAGAGGSSAGGSSAGASGAGAGGSSGGATAGAGGAADCATLKTDYAAAVELARVCDKGSSDQCTTSSTLPTLGGCGCGNLVNAKSKATTLAKEKYQAFQDAKCPVGPICNIACIAYKSATCSAAAMGNTFVCTGSSGIATP
jgi:hypothetical protein